MLRPILGILIIVCLCLDATGTAILSSWQMSGSVAQIIPYAAGFGFLLGQFALLIQWGALGAEPLSHRLPRAVGLTIFMFYAWCVGLIASGSPPPLDVSLTISFLLVILFLLLSVPFWLLNLLHNRRILIPGTPPTKNEQFQITHILIWTTAVAVISTVGKFVLGKSDDFASMPPIGLIWQFALLVVAIGIFMAALSLPLLIGTLSAHSRRSVWSTIGVVFVLGPPILHEGIYTVLGGTSPSAEDRFYGVLAWYAFYATMSVMIVGVLLLLRSTGYRLIDPDKVLISPYADSTGCVPGEAFSGNRSSNSADQIDGQ